MRGCTTCAELEKVLEETALGYWNILHKYRNNEASEKSPEMVTKLLRETKCAMDETQERYNQHVAVTHQPRQ